jgi:hypothetical protein
MARVKIESIVEHLDSEMRNALEEAVKELAPESNVDGYGLFRAFVRAVGRKCSAWECVPDHYVEKQS